MSKIALSIDQFHRMRNRELVEHGQVIIDTHMQHKLKELESLNELLRQHINKLADIQNLICLLDPDTLTLDKALDTLYQKYCIILRKSQMLSLHLDRETSKYQVDLNKLIADYEARIETIKSDHSVIVADLEHQVKDLTQKVASLTQKLERAKKYKKLYDDECSINVALAANFNSSCLVEIAQRESYLELAYRATLLDKLTASAGISLTGDFSKDFADLQSKLLKSARKLHQKK